MHDRRLTGAGFEGLHLFDEVGTGPTRQSGYAGVLQAFTLRAVTVGAGGRKALCIQGLAVRGACCVTHDDQRKAEHCTGPEDLDRHSLSPAVCVLRDLFEIC